MSKHRLDPLLKPASIALVGVSDRSGSPGQMLAKMVLDSDYAGDVYLVNPRYPEILGQPCYPYLESLPVTGRSRRDCARQSAPRRLHSEPTIEHGARAATIYSSGVLEQDSEPKLLQRLTAMAKTAGIQICGINGMGFYSVSHDLYAGIFPRSAEIIKGEISYIAQSGSAFHHSYVTTAADWVSTSASLPATRSPPRLPTTWTGASNKAIPA